MEFIEPNSGLKIGHIIGGLLGGLIAYLATPSEKVSPGRAFVALFVGAITAGYFTSVFMLYMNWGVELSGCVAFIIGIMSMPLVRAIMKYGLVLINKPLLIVKIIRNGSIKEIWTEVEQKNESENGES